MVSETLPNKLAVHQSSENPNWQTPPEVFGWWDRRIGFDVDAAADRERTRIPFTYFSPQGLDALKVRWRDWGTKFWMNPVYGNAEAPCGPNCQKKRCARRGWHASEYIPGIADFLKAAYEASLDGCTVLGLIPARTDTRYWHEYVMKARGVYFVEGRIPFVVPGGKGEPAPFPNAFVLWGGGAPGEHAGAPFFRSWSYKDAMREHLSLNP